MKITLENIKNMVKELEYDVSEPKISDDFIEFKFAEPYLKGCSPSMLFKVRISSYEMIVDVVGVANHTRFECPLAQEISLEDLEKLFDSLVKFSESVSNIGVENEPF